MIEHGTLSLDCGISDGDLNWYKDGLPLTPSNKFRFSPSKKKLYIIKAETDDEGKFFNALFLNFCILLENKIIRERIFLKCRFGDEKSG